MAEHGESSSDIPILTRSLLLASTSLLVPTAVLYGALLAQVKGRRSVFNFLVWGSILGFWVVWAALQAQLKCPLVESFVNFVVSVLTMKSLDLFQRRHSPPQYIHSPLPTAPTLALILLTELRYESFTPNHIRLSPSLTLRSPRPYLSSFLCSEPLQLLAHILLFVVLQMLPQVPPVQGLEVLLTIYIIWTSLQLLLRYRTSPPLFSPIYLADGISTFWTETWHNVFALPCLSICVLPVRDGLLSLSRTRNPRLRLQIAKPAANAAGILAAYALMSAFHVFCTLPFFPSASVERVGYFFLLNGACVVLESWIWGKRRTWGRVGWAWALELWMASWIVVATPLPEKVADVQWGCACGPIERLRP